jgi:acyl-homoserine-lactone acylase
MLNALADAVVDVTAHHLALDTPLGAVQQVTSPSGRIPIHGCPEGCYNIVSYPGWALSSAGGYPDITGGASFLMDTQLTHGGCQTRTLLTYGESDNPTSPHHWDQAALFSSKRWITERFTEAEIKADRHLTTTVLRPAAGKSAEASEGTRLGI